MFSLLVALKDHVASFIQNYTSAIKGVAVLISLISCYFRIFLQRKNWLIDTVSRALNLLVYIHMGLYGCVYRTMGSILMNFYGNHKWKAGDHVPLKPVYMSTKRMILIQGAAMVIGYFGVGSFLNYMGNTYSWHKGVVIPYLDGMHTLSGLTYLWMLANKYAQGWWFYSAWTTNWGIMLFMKGEYLLTVKHFIYLFATMYAYVRWKRMIDQDQSTAKK